ncbi:phage tail assembly protein [Thiomicrorhabdus sp.]|uniref:phage tail assembly protein n=1 Tax=Thiomicrorhabdus sp. TaxID=2039724 RepID=UPI0035669BDE
MTKKTAIKVTLSTPVKSGDEEINTVELRKPKAGELRGLQLAMVLQLDVDSVNTLLPRISNLSDRDIHNLEMEDYTAVSTELLGFFVKV